jgi:hypothetical protein
VPDPGGHAGSGSGIVVMGRRWPLTDLAAAAIRDIMLGQPRPVPVPSCMCCRARAVRLRALSLAWSSRGPLRPGRPSTPETVREALCAADRDNRAADQVMLDAAGNIERMTEIVHNQIYWATDLLMTRRLARRPTNPPESPALGPTTLSRVPTGS